MKIKQCALAAISLLTAFTVSASPAFADEYTKTVRTDVVAYVDGFYTLTIPEAISISKGEQNTDFPVTVKGDVGESQVITVSLNELIQNEAEDNVLLNGCSAKWDRTSMLTEGTTKTYTADTEKKHEKYSCIGMFNCTTDFSSKQA